MFILFQKYSFVCKFHQWSFHGFKYHGEWFSKIIKLFLKKSGICSVLTAAQLFNPAPSRIRSSGPPICSRPRCFVYRGRLHENMTVPYPSVQRTIHYCPAWPATRAAHTYTRIYFETAHRKYRDLRNSARFAKTFARSRLYRSRTPADCQGGHGLRQYFVYRRAGPKGAASVVLRKCHTDEFQRVA